MKPAAALRKLAEEQASWLRLPRAVCAATKRLKIPLPVSCSSSAATAACSCSTLAGTSPCSVSGSDTDVFSILHKLLHVKSEDGWGEVAQVAQSVALLGVH